MMIPIILFLILLDSLFVLSLKIQYSKPPSGFIYIPPLLDANDDIVNPYDRLGFSITIICF